jgi:hypothetical protein
MHTPDGDISIPVPTGVLGKQEATALSELASHYAAMGSNPWFGMQGTGTITYGSKDATAYPATLSNIGKHSFRLDAQTSKGSMSIRIDGFLEKSQSANGETLTMPPETALAGLFPFELARMAHYPAGSTGTTISVIRP